MGEGYGVEGKGYGRVKRDAGDEKGIWMMKKTSQDRRGTPVAYPRAEPTSVESHPSLPREGLRACPEAFARGRVVFSESGLRDGTR